MNWDSFDWVGAENRFRHCEVRQDHLVEVKSRADAMIAAEDRYKSVSKTTGIPWHVVGCIHQLECGGHFDRHLHNGDSLMNRTVHVPVARPIPDPLNGHFPYTWEESAHDALEGFYAKLDRWDIGHALVYLEAYNGFGYRKVGVVTPYIWSFTTAYTSGKFIVDGTFDPNAVSNQVGAAAILKLLNNWKVITLD